MKCPYCDGGKTTPTSVCNTDDRKKYRYKRLSKKLRGNDTIRRRRKCLSCGYRFNTVESHAEGGRMTRTCIFCGSEWEHSGEIHPENGYGICKGCLPNTSDAPETKACLRRSYPINFKFSYARDSWLGRLFEDITEYLTLAEELREED